MQQHQGKQPRVAHSWHWGGGCRTMWSFDHVFLFIKFLLRIQLPGFYKSKNTFIIGGVLCTRIRTTIALMTYEVRRKGALKLVSFIWPRGMMDDCHLLKLQKIHYHLKLIKNYLSRELTSSIMKLMNHLAFIELLGVSHMLKSSEKPCPLRSFCVDMMSEHQTS